MWTGLTEWANLSAARKAWLTLLELLNPSWLGVSDLLAVAVRQFALWALFWLPLILAIPAVLDPASGILGEIVALVSMLAYPSLLIVRLVLMIHESNIYTRIKTPPAWK